jgi:cytochrome P450
MENVVPATAAISGLPQPPLAQGFPIIGSVPNLLRQQIAFFEQSRAKYGDIYTLKLGGASVAMLGHPDFAQHVLVDNVRNYPKDGAIWQTIRALLGNGLATSAGDFWLRQRRIMQPHFHRQRLAALTEVMTCAVEETLESWRKFTVEAEPVDLTTEFARITMSVIMRTMFGANLSEQQFNSIGNDIAFIIDYLLPQAMTRSIPGWVPVPKRIRYKQALERVDQFIYGVIESRRKSLSNDLISLLIEAMDEDSGDQMTNQQLRDEVLTLFSAGYETTAVTLSWLVHFMTQLPELTEQLKAEVDSVLEGRTPTFEDVMLLPYTRQVLQETMRLRPPAYFLTRRALEDDEIGGYRIKAGQTVAVTIYTIHRHPDFWKNPEVFDPTRFSKEESESRHPLAWMPFGGGQRLCLGRDLAYMEGTIVLAMLVQRFNLSAPANFVVKPKLSIMLRPEKGVRVHLNAR